jgi:O-glycosyl hydrolase
MADQNHEKQAYCEVFCGMLKKACYSVRLTRLKQYEAPAATAGHPISADSILNRPSTTASPAMMMYVARKIGKYFRTHDLPCRCQNRTADSNLASMRDSTLGWMASNAVTKRRINAKNKKAARQARPA